MKGMGYFQNLRNFLEIFWIFVGIFWEFFRRIFLEELFGRNVLGGFFREEFFGRNYLVEINKELMFLSRIWGNARRRKKDKNLDP